MMHRFEQRAYLQAADAEREEMMTRMMHRFEQSAALAQRFDCIVRRATAQDTGTSEHSCRVASYSVLIARRLGLTETECSELRQTALLHDIGKAVVPQSILTKPGKLTPREYAIMQTHVTLGADILKNFALAGRIVEGAQFHQEHWDGKGYVSGLAGEDIPLFARIICVADAFDAMTQDRVYRKRLKLDFALWEIERCSGTQFDPTLARVLLDLVSEGTIKPIYMRHDRI